MYQRLNKLLDEQIRNIEIVKNSGYLEKVVRVAQLQVQTIKAGGKILIAGNGGSAADAQHFAAEYVGRFLKERKGIPAVSLTTDTSVLTCIGNDFGFDHIVERQLEALGKNGEIFVGISTSGDSGNILEAMKMAKQMGIITVGLLGHDGGRIKELCEYDMTVPLRETPRIQEIHTMTIHMLCELVEKAIFEEVRNGKIQED